MRKQYRSGECAMKKTGIVVPVAVWAALLVAGCGADRPARWTDRQGVTREIVFSRDSGSDLYDAYKACHTDWDCYQAYFAHHQQIIWIERIRSPFRRGEIRLHKEDGGARVFGEYYTNKWTNDPGEPFCTLTLRFDAAGKITKAEYEYIPWHTPLR
jgi:hypothetical protein